MSLGAGYFTGKELPEPILAEIPKIKIDPRQEPDIRVETVGGNIYGYRTTNVLRCANGLLTMVQWGAGETMTWMFPSDEFHWIMKGKAEVTYSLAGTSHTESKTVTVREGDIYLLPRGSRVTWKVEPSGPLRFLGIIMPSDATKARRPDKVHELK